MRISQAMADQINAQITHEFNASQTYLAMACMFDGMSLDALRAFFRRQADEEREHGLKFVDYLNEMDAPVKLESVPAPQVSFSSVVGALEASVAHEQTVTDQIHALVRRAEDERDYPTRSFLQWFVDEQVEEVSTMQNLLDIAKLAGPNVLQFEAYVRHLNAKEG